MASRAAADLGCTCDRRVDLAQGQPSRGGRLEHSEPHYAWPHPVGAGRGLGDYGGRDAGRLCSLPRGRHQRRGGRLSGQAVRHGHRARRLSRSARRQGTAGFDVRRPGHHRCRSPLARDPRRLARHHDRERGDSVVAGRQASTAQAAGGLQAQHRCANRVGLRGDGGDRIRLRCDHGGAGFDRARCGLDPAFHRLLCRGVGASHEPGRNRLLTGNFMPFEGTRREDPMSYGRHVTFWLVTFAVLAAVLWLLHDVLLPFVAGIALAYMLAPLADRLERLGLNRTVAALLIVGLFVVLLIALVVLLVPLLVQQGAALISHIPGYFKRIKELVLDQNLPWLTWLEGGDSTKTFSDMMGQVASWLLSFSYSLWTGGKALVSFASVLIVMPVVTFYLIRDWHRMLAMADNWIPVHQRETVRRLAREIDA